MKKKLKITFISLTDGVDVISLRFLSAFVKREGFSSELILLPRTYSEGLGSDVSFLYPYSNSVLEQLVEKCSKSDLIGLSLMTCHLDNAVLITNYLRKHLTCPIIWGGIHPTIRPFECIKYADMVSIGEAELSLSALLTEMSDGKSWKSISIPGIVKSGDDSKKLVPGPILEELSELPQPDYDFNDQYILYKDNQIIPLAKEIFSRCMYGIYRIATTRGCPYSCAYCCNNALNKIYCRKLPLRHRPIIDVIKELKIAKKDFIGIREIVITDDAFFAQPQERLVKFASEYKKKINLPFSVLTTPATFTLTNARILGDAGLYAAAIGIQSACLRTRKEIFKRYDKLEQVLSVGDVISQIAKETKKTIFMRYDIILDNPWESDADLEESIRFILKLKRPVELTLFSLTFYPGTELYEKAHKDGFIKDDLNQIYRKSQLAPTRTYLNAMFALAGLGMSKFLVEKLLSKKINRKHLVGFLYFLISVYKFKNGMRSVITKGILKGNFTWIKHIYTYSMDVVTQKINTKRHTDLKRFKGDVGELTFKKKKSNNKNRK